jgi:hypothetical protein
MHKVYKSYIYTVQRRDGATVSLAIGVAVIVVVEGDSCVVNGHGA